MIDAIVYAALIILITHLVFGVILWFRVRKLYSYPGILGFPVIGNLYYFYKTLFLFTIDRGFTYVNSIADEQGKDGVFFHWVFGSNVAAIITTPQLVKKLSLHPNLADKPHAAYKGFQVCMEGPFGTLRSDDEWKQKRKNFNNYLKKSRVDNDYYKTFTESADKLINIMSKSSSSGVDTMSVSMAVAHDVSLRTLFGVETSLIYHPEIVGLLNRVKDLASILTFNVTLISPLFHLLQSLSDLLLGKLVELRKLVLDELDNQLKLNQWSLPELPFSTYLLLKNRKDNGSKTKLFKEIHEVFVTSGHSVGTKLACTITFLAVLPDIQERAWQEQYEIFGNDTRDPTIKDLSQMTFLDRFLKESFRFLGPSFVGKDATADINVEGITIPRGTVVVYLLRYIKKHPKYWKNPNVFDPDRFLDENDCLKFCSAPFGIGIRNCPGEYFATIFMKITLSKMLRKLRFRPVEKDFRFEDIKFKSYLLTDVENHPKLQVEERT